MEQSQKKHIVEPADFFRLKYVTDARLSPDGKRIVYSISQVDAEKEKETVALWLFDLEKGEKRQLTSGSASDTSPAWSPDGSQIAFLSTRDGTPQVFIIPVDGGEARRITQWKRPVGEGPVWSPDGKYLAFCAPASDKLPDLSKPYRLTRNIFRFNAIGYLEGLSQDVFVLRLDGGEPRNLTHATGLCSSPTWSPDGQEFLFRCGLEPHTFMLHTELKSVDLEGHVRTLIDREWGDVRQAAWTPDARHIVFIGQQKKCPMGTKQDLWVIRRHGRNPECRTDLYQSEAGGGLQADMPLYPHSPIYISKDGLSAVIRSQRGGQISIDAIALQGQPAWNTLVEGERSVVFLDASPKQLLYLAGTWNEPVMLCISDAEGKNERTLLDPNQALVSDWEQPIVENLHFQGADGVPVEGWLMKSPQGKAPFPTLLCIHGGPTGAFGNIFSFDFQMLAGAGFAVLFINPRGSTGYGSDFATQLNLHWGEVDYQDLMAGLDFVIEQGVADPHRLGVYGLSYGGYMTCWIVTQTERFKGAVSENPVSDLVSDYGTGDASIWMDLDALGGHPQDYYENYVGSSPITYAHRCTTPMLMLQGEADYRCHAGQTEQFYTHLKASGCPVEMVRFPNSSHAESIMGAPIIRRTQNEELLAWMKKYVLGGKG